MKMSRKIIAVFLCIVMLFSFSACGENKNEEGSESTNASQSESSLWNDAYYKEDAEIGEGKTTVYVKVEAQNKSVTLTVHTDKTTLGEALFEYELIDGDEGEYGLYVKQVNGIKADYDTDKAYWAFFKDGEYMNSGVDQTEISDTEHYELVYTKD